MLIQYSTVIRDMLDAPTDETSIDGSDECPLLLPGDSSEGWELLLGLQYRVPLAEPERLRGKQVLKILMIAHKYCMERIELGFIAKLRTTWDDDGFVDMIVASQIIDSDDLYEDGLCRLIASKTLPTLAQAERMRVKVAHAVMRAVYTSLKTETETRMRILLDEHTQQLAAAFDRDYECSQQSAQWSYYNGQYQGQAMRVQKQVEIRHILQPKLTESGMAEAQLSPESNGHGQPQRHRDLYLEDGTLVIQVEDILFKVHRSVLARYSTIIRDMFNLPIDSWSNDGTDARPLVLSGDSAVAWELLLGLQYSVPLVEYKQLKGDQLLQILKIAHKYCMERIEADVIEELKWASDCDGPSMRRKKLQGEQLLKILPIAHKYRMEKIKSYVIEELKKSIDYDNFVHLIVASRIVDSTQLYQDGLQALITFRLSPTLEQANLIGAEATHKVMSAVIDALTEASVALEEANRAEVAAVRVEMEQQIATINANNAKEIATVKAQAEADARANHTKCRYCSQVTNWSCQTWPCRKAQL
ncbi:hypothetical protein FRC17_000494 [Serendipita sp. 399]|nr:hypothetical protein FRC17_000494 [Serendipita sp. 399]